MGRRPGAVTIPLQGGLGNQLFQLAAGVVVARRLGRPVSFSDFWLRHPGRHETPRPFALDDLLEPGELSRQWAPRLRGVTDRFPQIRVVERLANDDPLSRVRRSTFAVAGYFQRLEYVREAWPELRARLERSPRDEHRKVAQPVPAGCGALHYRLGDYLRHPGTRNAHGVTSPAYFVNEIRRAAEEDGVTFWQVVSDDPLTAVELLEEAGVPGSVRLKPSTGGGEWGDLHTLASARVCLLSNSSFSWWGGFLGSEAHGMRVVAPRPWFADPRVPEPDFFPSSWDRRERQLLAV